MSLCQNQEKNNKKIPDASGIDLLDVHFMSESAVPKSPKLYRP